MLFLYSIDLPRDTQYIIANFDTSTFCCKFTHSSLNLKLSWFQILDFGLARATDLEMTGYVATRYWRAPEIMLNWMHYGKQGAYTLHV